MEKISSNRAGEHIAIDAFPDLLPEFAEPDVGVLPRFEESGRTDSSREDGEELIGDMRSYCGNGYMQSLTSQTMRQELADTAWMVELPDYGKSGTGIIGGRA